MTYLVNLTAEVRCLVIYVGKHDCLVNLTPEVRCAVKLVMVNSRMIHRGRPVVGNPTFDLLIIRRGGEVFQSLKIDHVAPQTADF